MKDNESKLILTACINSVGGVVAMLAQDLYGRVEPGTINADHHERLMLGLKRMAELHHHFAALAQDMRFEPTPTN